MIVHELKVRMVLHLKGPLLEQVKNHSLNISRCPLRPISNLAHLFQQITLGKFSPEWLSTVSHPKADNMKAQYLHILLPASNA
jgi:hypothetical protein